MNAPDVTPRPGLIPAEGSQAVGVPQERVRHQLTAEDRLMRVLIALSGVWLCVSVLLPLWEVIYRSLVDKQGRWVGLSNYGQYFGSPALSISFGHSLIVAVASTAVAVGVAFAYAYALARTRVPAKAVFRLLAMLPLYAPSLAQGIALVYLFGTKGLVTTGLLEYGQKLLGRPVGFDIHLYGANGIVLGEVYYVFPQAFLILMVALALSDGRLHEASVALRASPVRTFLTVTVPSIKYGLVSAVFVCFTLAFTDFGVPKVVGGNYNVLATDIYKQVIGQQNFVMGATISILLLVPTIIAFGVDRLVQRRQMSVVSGRIVPLQPRRNRWVASAALAFCGLVVLGIVVPMVTISLAAVIDVWPYKLGLSLRHFDFRAAGGGGYTAYWDSLQLSIYTAVAGTALTFFSAYLVEKGRGARGLRSALYFLSMLPVALPGLVIGLAYIFFFNPRQFTIAGVAVPNPFNFLYATIGLLVVSNIAHFYTVSFMTATTALKQLDAEFEAVSASMKVPFHRTLWKVTLPLCLPAILEIGAYYFVNAMVTVSAVIFLYPPQFKLAAVVIVNMDDAGQTASAAAMSALLIFTSIGVRLLYSLVTRQLQRRTQAWRIF